MSTMLIAKYEWKSRPQFSRSMPNSFLEDVSSEGLSNIQIAVIFREIADELEQLARSYRAAAGDMQQ